jgi:hypothetical protein
MQKDALGPFLMDIFFNDNKIFLPTHIEILNISLNGAKKKRPY